LLNRICIYNKKGFNGVNKKEFTNSTKGNEIVRGGDNLSVYGKRALNVFIISIQSMFIKGIVETINGLEYSFRVYLSR